MKNRNRVLLVDDEASVRNPLAEFLERNGFRTRTAREAAEARKTLAVYKFDLAVLDVMMPGEDGYSLCRHIRERYDLPVIMLTGRGDETDRIFGLENGADDYLPKPFNPRELLARAHAVIRRFAAVPAAEAEDANALAFGDMKLMIKQRTLVGADGVETELTTGEYTLLHALLLRPRVELSREQLLDLSRERRLANSFDRSVDNMISRLRSKVETDPRNPEYIKTVWGRGYMFAADVTPL